MSILSYECIMNVDSLDSLIKLYENGGKTFQSEKDFLKFLKKDWKAAINEIVQRRKEEDYFENYTIEPVEVNVDDICYRIYGIIHDKRLVPKDYFDNLVKELKKEKKEIFLEQGINPFLKRFYGGKEINDHIFNSNIKLFEYGFQKGLVLPIQLTAFFIISCYCACSNKKIEEVLDEVIKNYNNNLFYRTFDSDLPAYVRLEIKLRNGESLNSIEKRSAYIAKFVQEWPEKENKVLVVGGAHEQEIKYFLTHDVKDVKICEEAKKNAELGYTYYSLYQHTAFDSRLNKISLLAGLGTALGGLGYGLWQFLS